MNRKKTIAHRNTRPQIKGRGRRSKTPLGKLPPTGGVYM